MVTKEAVLFGCVVGLVLSGGGAGFQAQYGGGNAIGPYIGGGGGACGAGGCAVDFNPVLLQGVRGYPGIRARINQRAFQYASGLIGQLLNQEIKRARIPPITQNIPQVNGCVQIYNLYVSRYRCPQRVVLYPAPPNRILLQVQNVDIGITGNLGGQIVILLPIALFGIIQINIHQATITVDLAVERGPYGPYLRLLTCNVQIGYADAYIENGGLIGDIINSQFRQRISSQVREMVPSQICGQLPSIINERVNSRLASLPQSIGVSQMLSLFGGALSLGGQTPSAQYCQTQCRGVARTAQLPAPQSSIAAPPAPQIPTAAAVSGGPAPAPQIPQVAYNERPAARGAQQKVYHTKQAAPLRRVKASRAAVVAAAPTAQRYRALNYRKGDKNRVALIPVVRNKRDTAHPILRVSNANATRNGFAQIVRTGRGVGGYGPAPYGPPMPGGNYGPPRVGVFRPGSGPIVQPPPPVPGAPPPMLVPPVPDLCAKCVTTGGQEDPMSFLRQLAGGLDLRKLNDLYLSLQLLGAHATTNDFTVDLSGEFSPNAQGGTPFGAFPLQFPYAYDTHMVELLLSDFTINSLFYWLHRKQFLMFRIGPDTPKIGELLKTTCSEEEDDELEATEVELDEQEARRRRRKLSKTAKSKRSRRASVKGRGKRQEGGSLADLGICFGDILPAVREKYPNQKIAIVIRTVRAPSVILSQARGGMLTLDLVADADIYIDGTNNRVGTITIAATVVLVAQLRGNRLTGSAEITNLKLTDRAGTLGLPQDALDNLGNLGKELIQKLANDALQKGIAINIPQGGLGGLPINIINPTVQIVEHGLYIATDITVSPSLLGITGGC